MHAKKTHTKNKTQRDFFSPNFYGFDHVGNENVVSNKTYFLIFPFEQYGFSLLVFPLLFLCHSLLGSDFFFSETDQNSPAGENRRGSETAGLGWPRPRRLLRLLLQMVPGPQLAAPQPRVNRKDGRRGEAWGPSRSSFLRKSSQVRQYVTSARQRVLPSITGHTMGLLVQPQQKAEKAPPWSPATHVRAPGLCLASSGALSPSSMSHPGLRPQPLRPGGVSRL